MAILAFETRVNGTIAEWDPPHAATFSMAGLRGMQSGTTRMILEATSGGTRTSRLTQLGPQPVLRPLWALLLPYFRRRGVAGVQQLKRLLVTGRV